MSEPFGAPLGFVEFFCRDATNLWLVTETQVYRDVDGDGCSCYQT